MNNKFNSWDDAYITLRNEMAKAIQEKSDKIQELETRLSDLQGRVISAPKGVPFFSGADWEALVAEAPGLLLPLKRYQTYLIKEGRLLHPE